MAASLEISGPLLVAVCELLARESIPEAITAGGGAGDSDALVLSFFTMSAGFCFFESRATIASLTRLVVPSACITVTFGLLTEPNLRPFLDLINGIHPVNDVFKKKSELQRIY